MPITQSAKVSATAFARRLKTEDFSEVKSKNPISLMAEIACVQSDICARCGGLVVREKMNGLPLETDVLRRGELCIQWRCIQCGNIVDPVILANRMHTTEINQKIEEMRKHRRPFHKLGNKKSLITMNEDRSIKDLLQTMRIDLNSRGKLNEDPDE